MSKKKKIRILKRRISELENYLSAIIPVEKYTKGKKIKSFETKSSGLSEEQQEQQREMIDFIKSQES